MTLPRMVAAPRSMTACVAKSQCIGLAPRSSRISGAFALATIYLSAMAAAKHDLIRTVSSALAALRAGRLADAETLSRRLLVASPRDPAAHQLAGTVALRLERFDEAEDRARASLALRPGHAPAMMLAGRAARARGDLAGAKVWFRRSSEIPGSGPEPLFQLGVAQIEGADPEFAATMRRSSDIFRARPAVGGRSAAH